MSLNSRVKALMKFRLLFVAGLVAVLAACQPTYTIERSEHYARQLGIATKYDIKRWHNRTIAADSRLVIAISPQEKIDSKEIFQIFNNGFAPYFTHIKAGIHSSSFEKPLAHAKKHRGEILVYIDPVNLDTGNNLKRAQLFISLFDVSSGKIIDKVILNARVPYYNVKGADLDSLLKASVKNFASNLSGV